MKLTWQPSRSFLRPPAPWSDRQCQSSRCSPQTVSPQRPPVHCQTGEPLNRPHHHPHRNDRTVPPHLFKLIEIAHHQVDWLHLEILRHQSQQQRHYSNGVSQRRAVEDGWGSRGEVGSYLQGLHVGRVGTVRQEPAVDRRVQRLHLQPCRGHQTVVRPRQRQSNSHVIECHRVW